MPLFIPPLQRTHSAFVCTFVHQTCSGCFLIVEATAAVPGFFQPAVDRIPADALDAGDGRFVQPLDAETGNLIKGSAAMLKPMVRSAGIGAERLLAGLASISTALPKAGLVETKTDNGSGSGCSRWSAVLVRAAGNLHGFLEPMTELIC